MRPPESFARAAVNNQDNAAGEVLTAKQAPHRPGTAPAVGLRAGIDVLSIVPQTPR